VVDVGCILVGMLQQRRVSCPVFRLRRRLGRVDRIRVLYVGAHGQVEGRGACGGENSVKIYGYFDSPEQTEPTFDPGLNVYCPVCYRKLTEMRPLMTISLLLEHDNRSYFYRVHKGCHDNLDQVQQSNLDGLIIDAVIASKNVN